MSVSLNDYCPRPNHTFREGWVHDFYESEKTTRPAKYYLLRLNDGRAHLYTSDGTSEIGRWRIDANDIKRFYKITPLFKLNLVEAPLGDNEYLRRMGVTVKS